MSLEELPTVLEVIVLQFVQAVQSGTPWAAALLQAEGRVLSLLPAAAVAAWNTVRPALAAVGEELETLAKAKVQPGCESVTSEDAARAKAGADLAKSGDAGPVT